MFFFLIENWLQFHAIFIGETGSQTNKRADGPCFFNKSKQRQRVHAIAKFFFVLALQRRVTQCKNSGGEESVHWQQWQTFNKMNPGAFLSFLNREKTAPCEISKHTHLHCQCLH